MDGHGKKGVWAVWSQDSKIGCISKMNQLNELIFLHGGANSGRQKVISIIFWVGVNKNRHDHLVHETLKSAEYFLHADFDAIIFY